MTSSLTPAAPVQSDYRLSEILAALSYAFDLTEGQPEGHAVRTCLIGMRLAMLRRQAGTALCPESVEALAARVD